MIKNIHLIRKSLLASLFFSLSLTAASAQEAAQVHTPATPSTSTALPSLPAKTDADPIANHLNLPTDIKVALPPPADLWERMRRGFAMPNLETDLAANRTDWYAKQPDYMQRMASRGSQYLYYIVGELEKRNMPTELALLPFVESAFNPQAVSSAKAAGMWQFMPLTGKAFALKQNVWQDDRRGVVESTRAALDYLQKLYGMFGNWHLALAAYNWGEGSVQRAINKNNAQGLAVGYTDLKMPKETEYYVPKFQAIKNIVATPAQYGIALPAVQNVPYFAAIIKERDIDVDLAAKFAGLSVPEFRALNPAFKRPVILGANKPEILLPADKIELFKTALEAHTGPLSSYAAVTLGKAEKPAALAARLGVSEAALRELNDIPPRMVIKPGSTLVVPKGRNATDENIAANMAESGVLDLQTEGGKAVSTNAKGRKVVVRKGSKNGKNVKAVARNTGKKKIAPARVVIKKK